MSEPARDILPNARSEGRDAGQATDKPVVVKKYANRRLYNTEASSYVTLDNLAQMVKDGRDFVVFDAKTGEDITRSVLTQIIVEEESKGSNLLPIPFLRQLISFYGDSLGALVPRYLEYTMHSFAQQQEQMRKAMRSTFEGFMPFNAPLTAMEEMGKQNMAMMERAMSLFSPFYRQGGPNQPGKPGDAPARPPADGDTAEVEALRREVERLRGLLEAQIAQAIRAPRR